MTDYLTEFRKLNLSDVTSDHIQPTPRWDLNKAFVFLEGISVDQLRKDLEEIVRINPKISKVYAIQGILYVLPSKLPEEAAREIRDEIERVSANVAAVFIRGATNPFIASGAKTEAGKLLHEAFKQLQKKYDDKIGWSFGEAKEHLNTAKALVEFNKELAKLEYMS